MPFRVSRMHLILIGILVVAAAAVLLYTVFLRPGDETLPSCTGADTCSLETISPGQKETLTPDQKKLSSDLLQLTGITRLPPGMTREGLEQQMEKGGQLRRVDANGVPNATGDHRIVYVYISTSGEVDQRLIRNLVMNITDADPVQNLTVAWVDIENLPDLAAISTVRSIRTVAPPVTS